MRRILMNIKITTKFFQPFIIGQKLIGPRTSIMYDIPLVFYGENPQFEYGGPTSSRQPKPMDKRWRQEFGGLRGLREEDLLGPDITEKDLKIFSFPDTGYKSSGLFYGDYFRWDPASHTEEIKKNLCRNSFL